MTTLIVTYAETLVDLLLRVDVLDAVDGSNSSRNDDNKDEDTMKARKGSVTGSVLPLHSQSIVVTDLDMCFQCLRDIVDGPHHLNQYYLSSSTPFLGICNRLMRHFQARRNRSGGRRRSVRSLAESCADQGRALASVTSSMLSAINCALEGRTDDVVRTRVSSVLQVSSVPFCF